MSKILIIKRESAELNRLVKNISQASAAGAELVEATAKSLSGLELGRTDLPVGEQATRNAIAKTKDHLLLHSKNEEFEFQILLTQNEALTYKTHLAAVVASNTADSESARKFSLLSVQLQQLQERVLTLLRTKLSSSRTATKD